MGHLLLERNDGRIKAGERRSRATEFKPGEHWRPIQQFRDKDWLTKEYVERQRSAADIAKQFGVTGNAICFWLGKHEIKTRSMSEIRKMKHWGANGSSNPMWNRKGELNPNWKGGVTPERQAVYASTEWKKASRSVWRRDQKTCQRCHAIYDRTSGVEFHVHHIQSFETKELRTEVSNLILLCDPCHNFVHSRKNIHQDFISKGGVN